MILLLFLLMFSQKEISNYYKVAISGDGGDELLEVIRVTMDSLKSKNHSLII